MSRADQIKPSRPAAYPADHDDRGTKPPEGSTPEELRAAEEAQNARNAQPSNRDRMVDIGRGNQQAGRQGRE